jgi:outer membrane protein TolC
MTVARVLALAVMLAAAGRPALAQDTLTLDQAVAAALSQNASLRAAHATAAEAGAQADAAGSVFFPRVSVSELWQRGNQPVFVFGSLLSARQFAAENFAIDALNHPVASGFFRTTVAVEQIVFDAARRAGADRATAGRDVADAAAAERAQTVTVQITETFGRVLSAGAALGAARAALESGREDLRRTRDRRDAGMATQADVLAFVVHVADLARRDIQAGADAAIARAELNRLMGAPVERDFRAIEPPPPVTGQIADLPALFAEAEAARPELQRASAAERAATHAERAARAAFMPAVAVQAAFDVSGLRFTDRASAWLVGGELRWTLSSGGGERAQARAAAQAVLRAQAERDDTRAAIRVEVAAAVRRLGAAQARVAAGRAAVEQAREAERIVRDRYEGGLAGVSDVLRASAAVLDADANRTSALVDAIVSHALLNRALGRRPS